LLELKNIYKVYDSGTINENILFKDFNLTVDNGQFVSVVGSNGSGKTSILNVVCGSVDIQSGAVFFNGTDITNMRDFKRYSKIGRVYQNPSMGTCADMTILENLSLADNKGKSYNLKKGTDKKRIDYYKQQLRSLNLGLEDKLESKAGSLSGGQRQALALLMSVMVPIEILILDEHTAALDPSTAEVIMNLTHKIIKENAITAIMVTHNVRYALEYGNRLIMMHKGKIILDLINEQKLSTKKEDILSLYNNINIE
jgi:putative ABC transport system ATP-binding protein